MKLVNNKGLLDLVQDWIQREKYKEDPQRNINRQVPTDIAWTTFMNWAVALEGQDKEMAGRERAPPHLRGLPATLMATMRMEERKHHLPDIRSTPARFPQIPPRRNIVLSSPTSDDERELVNRMNMLQ